MFDPKNILDQFTGHKGLPQGMGLGDAVAGWKASRR